MSAPGAVSGEHERVVRGLRVVFGEVGSVVPAAAFLSVERGRGDDARGGDHVSQHE